MRGRPALKGFAAVGFAAPGEDDGEPTTYKLEGRIATITIDDGKVNAFSIETLKAIHTAFDRAEEDGACRDQVARAER